MLQIFYQEKIAIFCEKSLLINIFLNKFEHPNPFWTSNSKFKIKLYLFSILCLLWTRFGHSNIDLKKKPSVTSNQYQIAKNT